MMYFLMNAAHKFCLDGIIKFYCIVLYCIYCMSLMRFFIISLCLNGLCKIILSKSDLRDVGKLSHTWPHDTQTHLPAAMCSFNWTINENKHLPIQHSLPAHLVMIPCSGWKGSRLWSFLKLLWHKSGNRHTDKTSNLYEYTSRYHANLLYDMILLFTHICSLL